MGLFVVLIEDRTEVKMVESRTGPLAAAMD